jgi:hypothetical protein
MRYSAKWSNKGLHSLLHGIGWTAQIILGKKTKLSAFHAHYQPTLLPLVKPCLLSAQHAHYQPTTRTIMFAISLPSSLLVYLAYYRYIMLTISLLYLAPSWRTICLLSVYYARYTPPPLLLLGIPCLL